MDARWGFLRAWLEAVRSCLELQYALERQGSSSRYIGVVLASLRAPATAEELAQAREVLVLLAMVHEVNRRAWKHVVTQYCGGRLNNRKEILEDDTFCVSFNVSGYGVVMNQLVAEFFGAVCSTPPSREFLEAARVISTTAGQTGIWDVDIPVRVKLNSGLNVDQKVTAAMWESIVGQLEPELDGRRFAVFAQLQQQEHQKELCVRVMFSLEHVQVSSGEDQLSSDGLTLLNKVMNTVRKTAERDDGLTLEELKLAITPKPEIMRYYANTMPMTASHHSNYMAWTSMTSST